MVRVTPLSLATVALIAILSASSELRAAILYVDAAATGVDDCSQWVDACRDLQAALAIAVASDEIWVATGTYKPNRGLPDRKGTFQLLNGVAIFGGFSGGETLRTQRNPRVNLCELSGDIAGDDGANFANYAENTFNVVTGNGTDATALLDGFTIRSGNASDTFGGPTSAGGGLHTLNGSPTIRSCVFTSNMADFGGAVFNEEASPTFTNCQFLDNQATFGGAMSNQAPVTGLQAPTLVNCLFWGNVADLGAGMVNWTSSSPTIVNCTFAQNVAANNGGAIANVESSPSITNSVFWANSDKGGADETGQIHTIVGVPVVNHSCVQGAWTGAGANNISTDPLFANIATGDLHLLMGSLSIDAGDNAAVSETLDLDGQPRIANATVDMGVYEFSPTAPTIASSDPVDGYIDPRCSVCTSSGVPIDQMTVTFDVPVRNLDGSPLDATAFVVSSTGGAAPMVASVDATGNPTIVITLTGSIEPLHWTTLTANVENLSGVETSLALDVAFLPGDVSQSGNVNISDASAFVAEFNGLKRLERVDINRSGNVNISDASAFVAVFNGGASGTALPARP